MTPASGSGETGDAGLRSRARKWWWVAAAAVVAVIAVVIIRSGQSDSSTPQASTTSATPSAPASSAAKPTSAAPSSAAPKTPSPSGSPAKSGDANSGRPRAKPVQFDRETAASGNVKVTVTKVESITSSAQIPGETSRPALRLTITARNAADKATTIRSAVVNLYYGKNRTPATSMLKPGSRWFSAKIPADGAATGIYIFNIPKDERDNVELEVDLATDLKIVTFKGDV